MPGITKESKLGTRRAAHDQGRVIIGVDEAGYGPNIGPLIVAATAWRVPSTISEAEFAARLGGQFLPQAWSQDCQHVPLGDSKQLYSPAVGLRTLEAGLLALLSQLDHLPRFDCGFADVLEALSRSAETPWRSSQQAWYARLPSDLPVTLPIEEVARLAGLAGQHLASCGIELLAVRACVVTESRFNAMLNRFGSKGRLLSTVTMELVTALLADHADSAVEVFCDRHGGRKKYSCVLLEAMPDEWFDTLDESPARSSYRRQRKPELRVHFSVGGDSFPPTALASMTAKYLRERLMSAINEFWCQHVVDLRPTAGYPGDARRFRDKIEAVAVELGHAVEDWWRTC